MIETSLLLKILLSVVIGAVLGLETETRSSTSIEEKSKLGGVRTYTILSLFGAMSGIFYLNKEYIFVYLFIVLVIGLIISAYVLNIRLKGAFGLTTEIAIMITFLLGFLTTSNLVELEIIFFLLIILAFFLSSKRGISVFASRIAHEEISDIVRFGLVAIVILPLLPNKDFFLVDVVNLLGIKGITLGNFSSFLLLNPFQIWFTVVLISGFTLIGYILSRIVGKSKGTIFTGFFSGFISSTAATISFATRSKVPEENENTSLYVTSSLFSKAASFLVLGALLFVNSPKLFDSIFFYLLILFVLSLLFGIIITFINRRSLSVKNYDVKHQPFSVIPAIKLVLIILVVRLFIQVLQNINFDEQWLIMITALSGAVGIDAPSIAVAGLFENKNIVLDLAVTTIILANYINFAAKIVYARIAGSVKFFRLYSFSLLLIGVIGFLIYLYAKQQNLIP